MSPMKQPTTESRCMQTRSLKSRFLFAISRSPKAFGLIALLLFAFIPAHGGALPGDPSSRATIGGIKADHPYSLPVVKNRPFVLERLTSQTGKNGETDARPIEEHRMRDALGRERIEIGYKDESAFIPTSVYLIDPIAGTTATLFPSTRTAVVGRQLPAPPDSPQKAIDPAGEPLPEKTIAGIQAEGRLTKLLIPASKSGTNQEVDITTERWFSPDLHIDLMTVVQDPRTGIHTSVVTGLERTVPSPALFQIPANYKQQSD